MVIQGKGIERDHCFIDNNNGLVTIYPQSGDVSIDGVLITEPTCLSQGMCVHICIIIYNITFFTNYINTLLYEGYIIKVKLFY